MARAGLVELQNGERVFYKHIDAFTREDRQYRLEAKRTAIARLRGRIEGENVAQALEEDGRA